MITTRRYRALSTLWATAPLLVAMLVTSSCDLAIFHKGVRTDAAALAQSGLQTAQSVQLVYTTLMSERLDVQKADAFHSIQVTGSCSIGPLPGDDQHVFDAQRDELQKRVVMAQDLTAVYQAFSDLSTFRATDARASATSLASDFSKLLPIPVSVSTRLPDGLGGVADILVSLKQKGEIQDYAKAVQAAAEGVNQVFAADTPALKALADERMHKITTLGKELMDCGLVSLSPVMQNLASEAGLSLTNDEGSYAKFKSNIIAVATLTPAQHISDTLDSIDADSAALASLVNAHEQFNASQQFTYKDLEYVVARAIAAAKKLSAAPVNTTTMASAANSN